MDEYKSTPDVEDGPEWGLVLGEVEAFIEVIVDLKCVQNVANGVLNEDFLFVLINLVTREIELNKGT